MQFLTLLVMNKVRSRGQREYLLPIGSAGRSTLSAGPIEDVAPKSSANHHPSNENPQCDIRWILRSEVISVSSGQTQVSLNIYHQIISVSYLAS